MPLAFLAPTSSVNFCEEVTLYAGTCAIFPNLKPYASCLPVLTSSDVVSAVRSHNIARINKSYGSFGDRFTAVAVDDLIKSDLLDVVKGM